MTKSTYRPVVGINNAASGFRDAHAPARLPAATFGTPYEVARIDVEVFDDETGRWRFFLPPGTVAFNANLYYYYAAEEGRVALRLNGPPVTPLHNVNVAHAGGPINESVLRRLVAGEEVLNYSPGAPANSLALSSPDNPIEPMSVGGWVYVDAQYPGGKLQRGLLQVFVHAGDYAQWYAGAQWDATDNPDENVEHILGAPTIEQLTTAQIALDRANRSGLADALRLFGKCDNDAELVNEVVASGVWAALLEFMRLSSGTKQ